jgi:cytidylate kinase
VILPNANVKIFLTASDECRAKRRCDELNAKGIAVTLEEVLEDMRERDRADSTRQIAPAVAAPDAIHFDNSYEGFDEALQALLSVIQNALKAKESCHE